MITIAIHICRCQRCTAEPQYIISRCTNYLRWESMRYGETDVNAKRVRNVWEISIQIQILPKLSLPDMKTRGTSIWFDRKLVSPPPAPTTTRHHFGRIGEQSVTSRSRALSVFLGGTGMGKFLVVRRISYLYFCPNKPMFDQKNK